MKIKSKTVIVFDIEVFPNYFCVVFKNTENNKFLCYEISSRRNDLEKIVKCLLIKSYIFCGYNCISYDTIICNWLIDSYMNLKYGRKSHIEICSRLKELNDEIIANEDNDKFSSWSKLKYANYFEQIDLLTMMFARKNRCGLKELQVTMQYPDVRESMINFNARLQTDEEMDETIAYCKNDVDSTSELLNRLQDKIDFRLQINKEYKVNLINKDDVNLGANLLRTQYLKATNQKLSDIKESPAKFTPFYFKDLIFDCIKFTTPKLQNILKQVKDTRINSMDQKWSLTFLLCGLEHTVSLGGLHSVANPKSYIADNNHLIIDWDCGLNNIGPR